MPCAEAIEVLSAHATFETKSFQDRPFERAAKIEVVLRSTSTTAISGLELAVFLGASLQAIEGTRPAALPTIRPRQLEGGGLAFRATAAEILPAGATRTVRVDKGDLPTDLQPSSVRALISECRYLLPVAEVSLISPQTEGTEVSPRYLWAGVLLALASGAGILWRLRR